jgi:hypothetical protein
MFPPLRLATSINYASTLFKRTRPPALIAAVALFSPPYPVDGWRSPGSARSSGTSG